MIEQDAHEASNKTIEYMDYLASFTNPSGVEQVQKARRQVKERPESDPEVFAKVLANQFGKDLDKKELIDG
jgi:hypothetical protein